jgi:hypothetical protein
VSAKRIQGRYFMTRGGNSHHSRQSTVVEEDSWTAKGINIVDASDLWPVWFETPKARNVTAWGAAPGSRAILTLSAEGAKFCVNLI